MITGGVGLIGSALARRLVDLGADVLLVDSMVVEGGANPANIASIRDRVRVNTADIRDAAAMRHLLDGQDFLFDLAAQTSHMDSMSAPFPDLEVNMHGAAATARNLPCGGAGDHHRPCRNAADLRPAALHPGR